ncbi:ion transporter [Akkermansiaceae bacterium]|nr:ion transporter [Akkermansiaceae bacterium]MDB4319615.1 ion transporter [bacterium]MDB4282793.1 ion transporter [Akkermansiaceae bacterium]MDB4322940.1 ion transporter [Akkermansiaceae bacterium]MDB4328248.1 ion transporter [Akkermansiaceae bacterium]
MHQFFLKNNLKKIVEGTDTVAGRVFDWFTQSTIIISIVAGSLETVDSLTIFQIECLKIIEITSIVIFTVELVLRIAVHDRGIRYLFTFYGIVDILAIAPYYLSFVIDLRSLRVLRLFRIFRLLKMTRYNKAVLRFMDAFSKAKEELVLFGCASMVFLFLVANGIYFFEGEVQPQGFGSIPKCLWWAVVTLTTVGYGDSYPITAGGKLFTFLILAVGLAIIAVPSGIIAASLSESKEDKENDEME